MYRLVTSQTSLNVFTWMTISVGSLGCSKAGSLFDHVIFLFAGDVRLDGSHTVPVTTLQ